MLRTAVSIKMMLLAGVVVAAILAGRPAGNLRAPARANQSTPGSEACASCHQDIFDSYSKTVMARASGNAADGLIAGEFDDRISGVECRVFEESGRVWMSYQRQGDSEFRGRRQLQYFIGSGVKGRTYVFSVDGYFFETPINWYSQEQKWNMTPAYTEAREVPMNLPLLSSCLNCHASGMGPRISRTRNKYVGAPFQHAGITCERCHGTGEGHTTGKGAIVNPVKLSPERRDSICMECHFEGTVAVRQPEKHIYDFQPGEDLSDYEHYFLYSTEGTQKPEALSQFEALSMSACKRKSGDKMWCGTCHDAHREPSAAERVSYFRAKCLTCHGSHFAAKHHASNPDCVHCHMPELPSKDVAHTQSTDHRILKNPLGAKLPSKPRNDDLTAFPASAASKVGLRDYALAWKNLAERGVPGAAEKADRYLEKASREFPDDPAILSILGYVEQERGHDKRARELYERALNLKPGRNTVTVNLGALEAKSGDLRDAVRLWEQAFKRVPYKSEIGINLALAFCTSGQTDEARRNVLRVLEFNPDDAEAKRLWSNLNADPVQCKD